MAENITIYRLDGGWWQARFSWEDGGATFGSGTSRAAALRALGENLERWGPEEADRPKRFDPLSPGYTGDTQLAPGAPVPTDAITNPPVKPMDIIDQLANRIHKLEARHSETQTWQEGQTRVNDQAEKRLAALEDPIGDGTSDEPNGLVRRQEVGRILANLIGRLDRLEAVEIETPRWSVLRQHIAPGAVGSGEIADDAVGLDELDEDVLDLLKGLGDRVGKLDDGPSLPAQINHLAGLVSKLTDRVFDLENPVEGDDDE